MQGPGTQCASSSLQGRTVPLCSELSLAGSNRDCRAGLPTTSPMAGIDAAIIQYHVQLKTALGITTSTGCTAPHLYFIITVEDCKETAWTALLKSMVPQFMSQFRYKTDSYNLLILLLLEGNNLCKHIQNNLLKVYHSFCHILTTKPFPLKILNCVIQNNACFTAKHSQRNGPRKEQCCCMKKAVSK